MQPKNTKYWSKDQTTKYATKYPLQPTTLRLPFIQQQRTSPILHISLLTQNLCSFSYKIGRKFATTGLTNKFFWWAFKMRSNIAHTDPTTGPEPTPSSYQVLHVNIYIYIWYLFEQPPPKVGQHFVSMLMMHLWARNGALCSCGCMCVNVVACVCVWACGFGQNAFCCWLFAFNH